MSGLKEFRARISSVKSTQKITRAMQMVAAARLRRVQEAVFASRPYTQGISRMVSSLSADLGSERPLLLGGRGSDRTCLLVVMTAERGLCGGFNSNIVKLARRRAGIYRESGKRVKLVTIGRKGSEALKGEFGDAVIEHIDLRHHRQISASVAVPIGEMLVRRFEAGEFDTASLVYSQFENILLQKPIELQLIPVLPSSAASGSACAIYEPDREQILSNLLPRYIQAQILGSLLENAAGEQGARMTAMDNATRNARDMLKALDLSYNRLRQAQITRELIEIISGAEAL